MQLLHNIFPHYNVSTDHDIVINELNEIEN